MPRFEHDGLSFHYRDEGRGVPFLFHHGLGADLGQPFGLYQPPRGVRLIGMDARAHGETRPIGDLKKIAIDAFADDLMALLDHLGLDRAVVGGISMGAAVALNAGLRNTSRVAGLVLSRPAWIDRPLPDNVRVYAHIALLILRHGARVGRERFRETEDYRRALAESTASAESLERQFTEPRAEECVARLERLPHDRPCHDREELAAIAVPTLVLGNRQDPIHPWEFAETIARLIPWATLSELTPKSESTARHTADFQRAVDAFLDRSYLSRNTNGKSG